MYKVIYLIFFPIYLISASININVLRDNNQTYSIMHLVDRDEITCEIQMNKDFKDQLLCRFQGEMLLKKLPLENRYFNISFTAHTARISPKYHFSYYPISNSFVSDDVIHDRKDIGANHWIIVGYKNKPSVYKLSKNQSMLDFPIKLKKTNLPMLGELDHDRNPVSGSDTTKLMLKLRQAYHDREYRDVLKKSTQILDSKEPLFFNEAKLYKIRALDKIIFESDTQKEDDGLDPDEVITLSLEWIEKNPSDVKLPELYMYVAKSYLKIGRASKAIQYLNILKNEYPESRYHFLAQLAYADSIYRGRDKNVAIKMYKDVLYTTKEFDIASMAALKLSKAYIETKKIKKAKGFIEKVLEANTAFIKLHAKRSYRLAKMFAENNESNVSLQIASLLKSETPDNGIDDDELEKNIAYWHEKNRDIEQAIGAYQSYLTDQKQGRYRDFVSEHLDMVMLDAQEDNVTKKLAQLDGVMKKYKDEAIYAKALLAKATILLENKKLQEILDLKEPLLKYGGNDLLQVVAQKLQIAAYHDRKCKDALALEAEYNLTVRPSEEEAAFICYKQNNALEKALDISLNKMKSEDLSKKLKWSYETEKLYLKLGKHKSLVLIAEDIDTLQKLLKTSKYNDVIYDKVLAYYRLGGYDDVMLHEVKRLEKLYPHAVKNLDVYEKVLNYAKKYHDNALIINYAKKMMALQEEHHVDTFTPMVQLDYINSLREEKRFQEALDETLKLLYKKLNDTQRAHVLYLAGDMSEHFKKIKEAKGFYTKCGEIVENSAWVELCSENLQLLDE